MELKEMLQLVINRGASDLHLIPEIPAQIRVDGELTLLKEPTPLSPEQIEDYITQMTTPEQKELFTGNKEVDFSYEFDHIGRFRVNAYYTKGSPAVAMRLIPQKVKSISELQLPSICHNLTQLRQGLILVTGPTGHGKSSTLAAMIQEINQNRNTHIITIEDPIEYVYTPDRSIISQREMLADTHSWNVALRSVLREDPDVVLVGEMRDYETIASALSVAETGHLVFATLHTNSAAQSVDRIIDVFPEHQQAQVRMQLASSLEAILSQRLIPSLQGGRVPAIEVLLANSAVRNLIREAKTHQLDNVIQTSADVGMNTLESSLAFWVKSNVISPEKAKEYSLRPEELQRLITGGQ